MKLIVAGSRALKDEQVVFQQISRLIESKRYAITYMIFGACAGVDSFAGMWARAYGMPYKVFRAKWKALKGRAGLECNQKMVDAGDVLLAIRVSGRSNKLTNDIVKRAKARGIPVIEWCHKEQ